MRNIFLAAVAALFVGNAHADDLEISLGSDSIRGEYLKPASEKVADNISLFDSGVLFKEVDDNNDAIMGHLGLLVFGDAGAKEANVQIGVGARAVFLNVDLNDFNGAAIALGGSLGARVPNFNRLGIKLTAFFAPDVSAFGDLDDFLEYGASLDYQLIRQAYLVVGYRKIRLGNKAGGSGDLDSGAYGGLRFNF